MRIEFSPINAAYVLVFGRYPNAQLIDLDGKRFWGTRAELVSALESKGLRVVRAESDHVVCDESYPR